MVNIFTRKITDELTSLVKQMDAVVGKNKSERMAGFVVLLTDDPDEGEEQLAAFAKKHKINRNTTHEKTWLCGLTGGGLRNS